ncbi:MAG: hypothetical protein ABEJ95_06170 [Candidatus Nanohalobium sp.]
MRDRILDIYELIKQGPKTVDQISDEAELSYSVAWKKTYALSELGKIDLFEAKRKDVHIAHHGSQAREDAELKALEPEEMQK